MLMFSFKVHEEIYLQPQIPYTFPSTFELFDLLSGLLCCKHGINPGLSWEAWRDALACLWIPGQMPDGVFGYLFMQAWGPYDYMHFIFCIDMVVTAKLMDNNSHGAARSASLHNNLYMCIWKQDLHELGSVLLMS